MRGLHGGTTGAIRVRTRESEGRASVRGLRSDGLPENHDYRDTGCDKHPSCLTCPFSTCRYDGDIRVMQHEARDREIVRLRADGLQVRAIAELCGISRRSVFRVLESRRKAAC